MTDGSVKIDITAEDSDIEKKLNKVGDEAEDAADKLDDLGDSSKKSGKGFDVASVAIGNFISGGVTALIGKVGEAITSLVALAEETREYREDMAKLDSAFTTNGHSVETAQKTYDGFYKILGESDRTVEAVNHLAEFTDNTEDLTKWQTIAAGVTAKFGDSLPIEGLTEAANETAKVGAVTGPLADALTWAGISEDAFNEKLKKCNSEQERAALITSTLNDEYAAAAEEYNKLTASTQAARDATNRMEKAQAALGEVMEPLTTAWTNIKASALEWVANGLSAKETTDSLTESQRTLVDGVNASATAYRTAKEAAAELAAAQLADADYATNTLLPQLQALVDSNGKVKKGYEERAAFIMGQLNEAYGTEYTRINEIIGANGQLTQSITNAINAKKAQILLQEQETKYAEAIKKVNDEQTRQKDLLNEIAAQVQIVEEAERRKQQVYEETAEAVRSGSESQVRQAMLKRGKVAAEFAEEKKVLDELGEAYNTSNGLIEGYNKDIEVYTEATTLMMKGKTEEAIAYLQNLGSGYEKTESQAKKSADGQKEALEGRLTQAAITLGLLKAEYEAGEASMTEAQKKEMKNRIAAAEKEVETLGTEAKKLGSNLVEGIGVGADGKSDWLAGKLGDIVSNAIEYAKKIGIIKSPSRKMRDEVGIPLVQGIAVGIKKAADEPMDAMRGVIDAMTKVLDEKHKTIKDTIKEYNSEIVQLEKDKNERLVELEERFAADKQKKDADIKALEKQYTKDVENINKQHADKLETIYGNIKNTIDGKMQEIVSLEEKYKEDVKQIWDDLDKAITDAQANYDNQLASRTASIASSMNLFSEVAKKSVSGSELTKNLKSQVSALENYNKAIEKLEGRNINADFLQSLKEMGVASESEITAISKMTDKQLEDYVALWEQKNSLAKDAALEELELLKAETESKIEELTNAALDKYATLRAKYQEESVLMMAELKTAMSESGIAGYEEIIGQIDDYTLAGEGLMEGVVAGIAGKSQLVIDAVTGAVNRAIAAAKEAAGIASPSKVMKKEVGANLAEGVKVGWADKIKGIKGSMADDMQGLTAKIKTAVQFENARMAQGVGVRDTGFTDIAQAVEMQTAGINSLASEYRKGSSASVTVPLVLNGRELGRAIIDLGNAETVRTGTSLSFA